MGFDPTPAREERRKEGEGRKEGRKEGGRKEGRKEGSKEGIKEGKKEEREETRKEKRFQRCKNLRRKPTYLQYLPNIVKKFKFLNKDPAFDEEIQLNGVGTG